MGRISPRNVPGAEIASEEEQIGNAHDDLKPDALRLPENESFPKANDATNPEKLTGNQHHEKDEGEHEIEGAGLAPTWGEPEGAQGNKRESDHAFVSSEETDYRHCRVLLETVRPIRSADTV